MKNKEKLQTAHTIVESLAAEAVEYENLLNDYAMMAEEGDTERSAWEKTWRDEFEHHVANLREVTHLLAEFIKSEESADEVSKDVVNNVAPTDEYIICTDGRKAFVGNKIRVVGVPENFMLSNREITAEGKIKEIGWYYDQHDDEDYYGFILEDLNKFYLGNCEIYLIGES